MSKFLKIILSLCFTSIFQISIAGNSDRAGEAGAYELLMNSHPRTMGLMGINSASVRGTDALGTNISGLAFNKGLSVFANYLNWLNGTETSLYSIGVANELSPGNSIAFNVNYLTYGQLKLTTTANPEPIGTFSPYMMNLALSYAHVFGRGVRGGITGRMVNEGISNLSASGFALDAGIQYTTGDKEDFHFGVFIRNLGFPMKFSGDGLIKSAPANNIANYDLPFYQRAAKFELPAQFSIAITKDLFFGKKPQSEVFCKPAHRLSISSNFVYNSFTPNNYGLGLDYAFKETLGLRIGYLYEDRAFDKNLTTRAHMGLAAGVSYDFKLGGKSTKNPSVLEIAYNYRPTWVFSGTHNIGFTFYSSKYSYCDEYIITEKMQEVVPIPAPVAAKPEIKYITKYDTIFKQLPPKIETVVEYKQVNSMLKDLTGNIEFRTATAILTDRGEGALMVIGEVMKNYPQARYKISGHTDGDGTPENNMRLSKLRAKTVARYLTEFKSIPENSMDVEWHGEDQPIADNNSADGRQRNRRVEITVLDKNLESQSNMSSSLSTPIVTPKSPIINETPAKVEDDNKKSVQDEITELASSMTFKIGTDSLTRFAKRDIKKIAALLKSHTAEKLKIEAHTDNSKYTMNNLDLSLARAKSIVDALKAEGIEETRITSVGLGDTQPVDTNESEFGKAKNRRIVLKLFK